MAIFSFLLYYLVIIPVSVLPFPLLYLVSDFLFLLLFYIAPYRKKIVYTNLRNAFPHKTETEIHDIARKFYRHLCDIILETIKSFTISGAELKKRMVYKNPEIFDSYYIGKKSVICVTGHFNNWEWFAMVSPFYIKHKAYALYMPLSDYFFNEKVRHSRNKFGISMYSVRDTRENFEKYKSEITATGFVSDQTPSNVSRCYWMNFLNQDTPVYLGTEKYAIIYNYPVIFCKIEKIKRGYYEVEFNVISESPSTEEPLAITERHTKYLEDIIIDKPEYWLWSHKRWKHKRKVTD